MALADVAVGSHGVGNELNIDAEMVVGGPRERRRRSAERRRAAPAAALLERRRREGQHGIRRSASAQPKLQRVKKQTALQQSTDECHFCARRLRKGTRSAVPLAMPRTIPNCPIANHRARIPRIRTRILSSMHSRAQHHAIIKTSSGRDELQSYRYRTVRCLECGYEYSYEYLQSKRTVYSLQLFGAARVLPGPARCFPAPALQTSFLEIRRVSTDSERHLQSNGRSGPRTDFRKARGRELQTFDNSCFAGCLLLAMSSAGRDDDEKPNNNRRRQALANLKSRRGLGSADGEAGVSASPGSCGHAVRGALGIAHELNSCSLLAAARVVGPLHECLIMLCPILLPG